MHTAKVTIQGKRLIKTLKFHCCICQLGKPSPLKTGVKSRKKEMCKRGKDILQAVEEKKQRACKTDCPHSA